MSSLHVCPSPGCGYCVVFLVKTLYSSSTSLHIPGCIRWVLANILLVVTLQWTSIPSSGGGGGYKYFKWLHAPGITQDLCTSPMDHLAQMQALLLLPNSVAAKQMTPELVG